MPAAVPHFSYPFRFGGPQAEVSEQDSLDEVADCCVRILLCPETFRVELPEFGLPDPAFSTPRVDVDVIRTVVDTWEPRAAMIAHEEPDFLDQAVSRVQALVSLRTEE
jgi:hypothetical protein